MIENTYPIESGAFLDKPIKDYKSSSFKTRKIYFSNVRKNKLKYNYPNNFVKTSKYTFYDFFPKALLFQFFRYANCYFLLIAIVQIFPAVSPLSPVTAIVPLVIVLLISIIREGIEDYYRHVSDEKENMEVVQKYNGRTFSQELSKNLEVGDIIKVDEYDIVPADIILISCKNLSKIAYVETANLDGEKNLKPKFCVPQLFNIFKDIDIISRMKGEMKCDIPNSKLSEFNGRVKLSKTNDYSVNVKQLLHKGTILKNTPWAIGLVVYSGKDTKIILNSQKSQSKSSHLEMNVNILILFIFGFQIILCIILAIICSSWTSNNLNYISNYILPIIPTYTAGFYSFWSYLLLLNTMIPISLIVSIEIVKYAQGYFMNNDIEMYSVVKDKFCKVNSCTLNEELGQLKYIFSDKTGTLTANKLEFKGCVIGDTLYGVPESFIQDIMEDQLKRVITKKSGGRGMKFEFSLPSFSQIKDMISQKNLKGKELNIELKSISGRESLIIKHQRDLVEHYLINLAVNQTCFVDRTKIPVSTPTEKILDGLSDEKRINDINSSNANNNLNQEMQETDLIQYKGENPDEIIFVDTARNLGVAYMGGDATLAKLKIIRESDNYYKTANEDIDLKRNYCENLEIEILMINEFTSDRGMMSIVVEYNNNVILYAKGGDKKIKDLLAKSQPLSNRTVPIATKLSETGLRVLLITMKILDKSEFNEWRMNYEEGLKTISEEEKNTYKNTNLKNIEKDMILIGCTAVEDRLQDEVPDVIKEIQDAGINFWVLTGDNLATARNIGLMCNLLPKHMDIYEINDDINVFMAKVDTENSGKIFLRNQIEEAKSKIKKFEDLNREVYLDTDTPEYLEKKGIIYVGLEILIERYKESEFKNASVLRGVLVESEMLRMLLPNENYSDVKYYGHPLARQFLTITLNSQAVICCRVAPRQKALVVRMIKKNVVGAITLSIGDGANDVSMISEADVGVGLFGEEGTQAAMASDYACGDFKALRRLVLYHGRLNYVRISEMILYFFFKNFIFTIPQFFFAFYSGFSGMTLFDDWYVSLYNMLFTSLPLIIKALFEKDFVDPEEKIGFSSDKSFFANYIPFTYYVGKESLIFNQINLFYNLSISLIYSIIVYFCVTYIMRDSVAGAYGFMADYWVISITQFSAIILIVTFRIVLTCRHFTFYNIFFLIFSIFSYIAYIIFANYFFYSKSMATLGGLVYFPQFYLSIFLLSSIQFLIDLGILFQRCIFEQDPVNYIRKYEIEKNYCLNNNDNQEIEPICRSYQKLIKGYDDDMKNKYKVKRVYISE